MLSRAGFTSVVLLSALSGVALGVPTVVIPEETPDCDPLVVPTLVDELGNPPAFTPFPDELITSTSTFTSVSACPPMDAAGMPNALVVMTNMTVRAFRDLWYVGDFGPTPGGGPPPFTPLTLMSNSDGIIHTPAFMTDNGLTFKIDTVGVNTPLVFESGAPDGIFSPGETWHFIIQDYVNLLGIPAGAMGSIGVAGGSAAGPASSGSIIAIEVPEPGSAGALGALIATLAARRRRAM
ncbi:MAG: PEP-CTERM sorting domain-containing protein [Anaerolineae bacterium]|nr:PEP-CTERM sorting domain-containing protein [Phycisphaerae bacterium]